MLLSSDAFLARYGVVADRIGNAHNSYLEILAGGGAVGCLAWLAILLWTGWRLLRSREAQGVVIRVLFVALFYPRVHILHPRASVHPGGRTSLDCGRLRRIPGYGPGENKSPSTTTTNNPAAGGEDQAFLAEADLLEVHGHAVTRFAVHNDAVHGMGRLALARATVWNGEQYRELRRSSTRCDPRWCTSTTLLPLISPAVYYAAKAEGAGGGADAAQLPPVRCVNGLLFRDGRVCEDCLGRLAPWPGVLRGCYRGSRAASAAVAAMVGYHKLRGTYRERVDAYIALTDSRARSSLRRACPPESSP